MKLLFISLVTLCFISCKKSGDTTPAPVITVDSFTVTVNNGYGTGKYKIGDTVHIWSKELTSTQVFDTWTGDITALNNNDWHAWFIMPNKNINVTANIKSITPFTLNYEMIRGRDRLKPVY